MDVKPYEFIGFGAMDVTKPYEFMGFGDSVNHVDHVLLGRQNSNLKSAHRSTPVCQGRPTTLGGCPMGV